MEISFFVVVKSKYHVRVLSVSMKQLTIKKTIVHIVKIL